MALGKRIESRLRELGWERKDLLDVVCQLGLSEGKVLSASALGQLINRDSRRSEWDVIIAQALGMSVMELVYGTENPYRLNEYVVPMLAAEPGTAGLCVPGKNRTNIISLPAPAENSTNALKLELNAIAESMNDRGITELIGHARALAKIHPKTKANLVS